MIRVESHGEVTFFRLARGLLGRPVFWGGAYLAGDLLVDCGPPVTARELLRALEGRRVSGLAVTHSHEDHWGGAALLARERGVVAQIHPAGLPHLVGYDVPVYRRVAWGRPEGTRAHALGSTVDSALGRFEVIHTPGHSDDHVCLFEPERGWLFTGDLFLAERLRYLRDDESLGLLIASLERVAALPVRQVFCAHRGPVRDGPAALRRKAERLVSLRGRILELVTQGLREREIARRVVGPEGAISWLSAGSLSARNFVRAVRREAGLGILDSVHS
jgi:glyoxylase-like metal-dependent hydrolase (beta-lactamase superfamily II)